MTKLNFLKIKICFRACLIAKTLYGPTAESICVELISQGRLTVSETIRRVKSLDETAVFSDIRQSFQALAASQFLIRMPDVESELHGCPQFVVKYDPFTVPEKLMEKKKEAEGSRKRKAAEDEDSGQYWRINWVRFDAYLRDELIMDYLVGGGSQGTMTNVKKEETEGEDRTQFITQNVAQLMFKINETRAKPLSMESITASVSLPYF